MKTFYPIPMHYKYEFHLLPRDSFVLHTRLSLADVTLLLDSLIDTKYRMGNRKLFHGKREGNSFQIFYLISFYRNGLLRPKLEGEIFPTPEGCEIRVTSRPHILPFLFTILWLVAGTLITLAALLSSLPLQSGTQLLPMFLTEAVILCFGWLLPTLFFWLDESRIKAVLQEQLQCPKPFQ